MNTDIVCLSNNQIIKRISKAQSIYIVLIISPFDRVVDAIYEDVILASWHCQRLMKLRELEGNYYLRVSRFVIAPFHHIENLEQIKLLTGIVSERRIAQEPVGYFHSLLNSAKYLF